MSGAVQWLRTSRIPNCWPPCVRVKCPLCHTGLDKSTLLMTARATHPAQLLGKHSSRTQQSGNGSLECVVSRRPPARLSTVLTWHPPGPQTHRRPLIDALSFGGYFESAPRRWPAPRLRLHPCRGGLAMRHRVSRVESCRSRRIARGSTSADRLVTRRSGSLWRVIRNRDPGQREVLNAILPPNSASRSKGDYVPQ